MNIKGLDYNTKRKPLLMPEYGREIQKMVDYAATLPNKTDRQRCAETIVKLMITKVPQLRENSNYEQTLWDHLYLMSHKQLDINWPYDVAEAEKLLAKPAPMPLPSRGDHVHLRHYGHLVEKLFERLKASAPSIHMIRADIETEVSPIVGGEKQSEDMIHYLLQEYEGDSNKIWEANIFGKSLHELVNEDLNAKIKRMPEDARAKLRETLQRIINEGSGGLICIIL